MPYNSDIHHRRSIRLAGYDYASEGAYFITICTAQREHLFGRMQEGEMRMNAFGRIVEEEWRRTSVVRPQIIVDAFIVMPDHLHGILIIDHRAVGATRRVALPDRANGSARGAIGAIIGQFKSITTKRINHQRGTTGMSLWQRNYYEHIVRSEQELYALGEYIANNPARWSETR